MPDIPDWLQQWLKTVSLWDVTLWALGAAVAIWLIRRFVKKGWPALKLFAKRLTAFINTVDAVVGLPAFIARTDATLEAQNTKIADIHHETHNNNGSSIKDSTDRIEEGVAGLYKRVDQLEDNLATLRTDFDDTHPKSSLPKPPTDQDQS